MLQSKHEKDHQFTPYVAVSFLLLFFVVHQRNILKRSFFRFYSLLTLSPKFQLKQCQQLKRKTCTEMTTFDAWQITEIGNFITTHWLEQTSLIEKWRPIDQSILLLSLCIFIQGILALTHAHTKRCSRLYFILIKYVASCMNSIESLCIWNMILSIVERGQTTLESGISPWIWDQRLCVPWKKKPFHCVTLILSTSIFQLFNISKWILEINWILANAAGYFLG